MMISIVGKRIYHFSINNNRNELRSDIMSKYRSFKRCGYHGFLGDTGYAIHNLNEFKSACKSGCLTTKDVVLVKLTDDSCEEESTDIQNILFSILDPIVKKSVLETIVLRKSKIKNASLSDENPYEEEMKILDKDIDYLVDRLTPYLDFKKYNYNILWYTKAVREGEAQADKDGLIKFLLSHQKVDLKDKAKQTIYKTTGKMLLSGRSFDNSDSIYNYDNMIALEGLLDTDFVRNSLGLNSDIVLSADSNMARLVDDLGLYLSSVRGFMGITGAKSKDGYGYLFYSIYIMALNFYLWMNSSLMVRDGNYNIYNSNVFDTAYLVTIYPDGKFSYSIENFKVLRESLLNAWVDNLDRVFALYSSEYEREQARRNFYMTNCFGLVSEIYVPENKYMLLLPKKLKEDLSIEVQLESAINFMIKRDSSYIKKYLQN